MQLSGMNQLLSDVTAFIAFHLWISGCRNIQGNNVIVEYAKAAILLKISKLHKKIDVKEA